MLGIRYKRYIYSIKIYRTQTKGGLRPVFPLISPVLQEAPRAPRYKEGVAGDTQPVRPGGRWGGGVPSWRKSVSEAPIAASVCRFGNRGMLREDDPEERREATEDEFKVFHFS